MKIRCMFDGCPNDFSRNDIQRFVGDELYKKYMHFRDNINVDMDDNLRWCPNPKCNYYVRKKGKSKTTACEECNTEVCLKCGAVAHGKVRCANVGDHEMENWQKENGNVKYCPKCNVRTERISGCAKIKCTRCQLGWCWNCRAECTYSHFREEGKKCRPAIWGHLRCPGYYAKPSNCCLILKAILKLILLPIYLFFSPFAYVFKDYAERGPPCNFCTVISFLLCTFPIMIVISTIMGTMYLAFGLIPGYIQLPVRITRLCYAKSKKTCCHIGCFNKGKYC
jgi:hypothetical protein